MFNIFGIIERYYTGHIRINCAEVIIRSGYGKSYADGYPPTSLLQDNAGKAVIIPNGIGRYVIVLHEKISQKLGILSRR